MPSSTSRLSSYALGVWAGLAILVNAVAFAATHLTHRPEVAYAAAFDVAVTVPALYYLLVVRSGAQPALTLLPLGLVALLRALYVAPGAAVARPAFGAVAELVVLGFLVVRVRRGLRAGDSRDDIVERIRRVGLEMARLPALADILATEVAIFYYTFAWRPTAHAPRGTRAFSIHRESGVGGWFVCLAFVSLMEAAVVHLLVAVSRPGLAWLLTALSVYGAVWLVAMGRSFALRPILVGASELEIRSGLLARVRVPRALVASAEMIGAEEPGDWRITPLTAPNVRVTFTAPVEASALYGRKRTVTRIALTVDDPHALLEALRPEVLP